MACDVAIEQLGLFENATSHLTAARRSLARFDLDAAERSLAQHIEIFAGDQAARTLLETVRTLRSRRSAAAGDSTELDALLGIHAAVPADLLPAWHLRIVELAGNERDRARAAGEDAPRDARSRALLADALYLSGDRESARREYLRAFTDDAAAIPTERIADPDVARLLSQARFEYELDEPLAAWIPPVGIVERVFPLPQAALPGMISDSAERSAPLAFVDLIARERAGRTLDERVAVRRRMKALAPLLFEAYLRAFVR